MFEVYFKTFEFHRARSKKKMCIPNWIVRYSCHKWTFLLVGWYFGETSSFFVQCALQIVFVGLFFLEYVKNLKNLLTLRSVFRKRLWKPTNNCCYRLTFSNVYTVKKMYSQWYWSQYNKIGKVWVRVEFFCLNFLKTCRNQYIKLRKVETFRNYERTEL